MNDQRWEERPIIVWCDARCTLADGPTCRCLCRGKFHGLGYVLPEPHGFEAPAPSSLEAYRERRERSV